MAARERPTKYVYSIHIHNVIGNQSKNFPTVPMSKSDFFLQYTYIPQQGILLGWGSENPEIKQPT